MSDRYRPFLLRAGPRALRHILDRGLAPGDIACVPAAAGGPKGLALLPFDHLLLQHGWLPEESPVELIGASVGAWRMAALAQVDPLAALERVQHAYVHQQSYSARPTPPEVSTAYGDHMLLMAKQGPGLISPKEIKGLVAFPSYHIVLAITAVYASRTVKWAFPIYLVLNALILPGIYLHGGHHMIDLPAGLMVAAAGLYVAHKAVAKHYEKEQLPEYLEQ